MQPMLLNIKKICQVIKQCLWAYKMQKSYQKQSAGVQLYTVVLIETSMVVSRK